MNPDPDTQHWTFWDGLWSAECGSGRFLTGFSFGFYWKEVGSGSGSWLCLRVYADSWSNSFFSHNRSEFVLLLSKTICYEAHWIVHLSKPNWKISGGTLIGVKYKKILRNKEWWPTPTLLTSTGTYLFLGYNWVADGCILYVMFPSLCSHIIYSGCVPTLPLVSAAVINKEKHAAYIRPRFCRKETQILRNIDRQSRSVPTVLVAELFFETPVIQKSQKDNCFRLETVKLFGCQCCGSGSGSLGSVCFWASRIWIRIRIQILLLTCKNSSKTLDFCYFVASFWLFIYENWFSAPLKVINKRNFLKKLIFCWHFLLTNNAGSGAKSGSVSQCCASDSE